MSKIKVIEVNGDRYARLADLLRFVSENEATFLRAGETSEAAVMKALGAVLGKLEDAELRTWFS